MVVAEASHAPVTLDTEWRVRGTIQVVLTLNLGNSAFSARGNSRERYWSVRGGADFAAWLRRLGERVSKRGMPFELDRESARLTDQAYGSGLLTQYLVDQEILPGYTVRPDVRPEFAFDEDAGKLFGADDEPLRARLEEAGTARLLRAWEAWPSKRIRLSRYGIVQVILETVPGNGCTRATDFVAPIATLNPSLGVKELGLASVTGEDDPLHELLSRPKVQAEGQGISVQWEILGRLLTWLLDLIYESRDRDDLLHLDPQYWINWRRRRRFSGGQDLPLRRRFVIFRIGSLECSDGDEWSEAPEITPSLRMVLAQLAEGTPLVEVEPGRPELSPQRRDTLRQTARNDRSNWRREACFLSHDTAVIANLHEPDLAMKLYCDLRYEDYWKIVSRTFEYLAELRIAARLLQLDTSSHLEELMKVVGHGDLRRERRASTIVFAAAASGLVARLRNASTPNTVSPADALLSKLTSLRQAFGIVEALEHTDRNVSSIQQLIGHSENIDVQRSVLNLTIGLAAFTAVMMGMGLATFVRELLGPGALARLPSWVALVWTVLTIALIAVAFSHILSLWLSKVTPSWNRLYGRVRGWWRASFQAIRKTGSPRLHLLSSEPTCLALTLSDGTGPPRQATTVFMTADDERLRVRFECIDADPWSTLTERDEALWSEEVVEVFLAPGREDPRMYVELEVNPGGAVFDAVVRNPTGRRAELAVDRSWDCPRLRHRAGRSPEGWWAELEIPWQPVLHALGLDPMPLPKVWRANFYRIDRPRDGTGAEWSAWSPTHAKQPDFHRPRHFGVLELG